MHAFAEDRATRAQYRSELATVMEAKLKLLKASRRAVTAEQRAKSRGDTRTAIDYGVTAAQWKRMANAPMTLATARKVCKGLADA